VSLSDDGDDNKGVQNVYESVTSANIQKHLAKLFATVQSTSYSPLFTSLTFVRHLSHCLIPLSAGQQPHQQHCPLSLRTQRVWFFLPHSSEGGLPCCRHVFEGTTTLLRTLSNSSSKWWAKTFVRYCRHVMIR
jgi:hypothetical protein